MSLRAQIGWWWKGRATTHAALDSLAADLRALQARVDALQGELHAVAEQTRLDAAELRQRQLAEFDAVRDAVAHAVDDLSARVAAAGDQAS